MKSIFTGFLLLACIALLSAQSGFQLTVQNGYGSGLYAAGDSVFIWSEEWPGNATFSHWSGDTSFLERPLEWRTRVIMPAHAVTVNAHTEALPTGTANYFNYELIQGANIKKPVYYYFPPGGPPQLTVWLWHGSGGGARNWVYQNFEMRQFCNYLVAHDIAFIVTEGDEATLHTDLTGDGDLHYSFTPDTVSNWDLANVRAIRDTFILRGMMDWNTPQAAEGFSAGGAFSIFSAGIFHWQAAVSHNQAGPTALFPFLDVPVQFSMTLLDNGENVGPQGNQEAFDNYQFLLGQGKCTRFFMLAPSPLHPQRFKRIPGINGAESLALATELVNNGVVDADGYILQPGNVIENIVAANPQNWPVVLSLSDTLQGWVRDELAVMYTSHHFHHDYMAADLDFLLRGCDASPVGVEVPEMSSDWQSFPNPTNGLVFLPKNADEVRVFDSQGKLVLEKTALDGNALQVGSLPAGLYFLKGKRRQGGRLQVFSGRFVKI